MRRLTKIEWDAVVAAHAEIFQVVRSFDRFLRFAWMDLEAARTALLEEWSVGPRDRGTASLLEYRLLSFSTALKMYDTYVTAEVNRREDAYLKSVARGLFTELYDSSQGYRVVFCLRNAFQHGVRNLVRLSGGGRLVGDSLTDVEAHLHAYLIRDAFASSGANSTVRKEVRDAEAEFEILGLCADAYAGVQRLHARLTPLLHPNAPAAARVLLGYMREIGNERAHFHEYPEGAPHQPLSTRTLDPEGFDYVVAQAGGRTA